MSEPKSVQHLSEPLQRARTFINDVSDFEVMDDVTNMDGTPMTDSISLRNRFEDGSNSFVLGLVEGKSEYVVEKYTSSDVDLTNNETIVDVIDTFASDDLLGAVKCLLHTAACANVDSQIQNWEMVMELTGSFPRKN